MNIVKVIDPPLCIVFEDLIVMRTGKERFAYTFLRKSVHYQSPLKITSPDFRSFILYDREHIFGEKQARIIKFLYDKYVEGDPWVHAKKLIDIADVHSARLQHLFNRNRNWRNIIKSGRNGWYMFNLPTDKIPPSKIVEYAGPDLFDFGHK